MSENKRVVEQYMEGFRRSDHEMILTCLTDDVVWDLPGAKLTGPAKWILGGWQWTGVTQYQTGAGRNYGRFSEQAQDRLLDKALGELDRPARDRLMEEYQRKWLSDWQPRVVLHANAAGRLVQPNLGGYEQIAGTWQQDAGAQRYGRLYFVGAPSGNRPPTG